ncbi:hypothetical protein [Spirillospora sp. CA-294931]|uniref:hypothetical protein n=1 Tax=Spirillospora sp. CA-294931 TaxID=3240042 RepID=UPI003D8A2B8C
MRLLITAWPRINGSTHQPGDIVTVDDEGLAGMLIKDGQARPEGTPEPVPRGRPTHTSEDPIEDPATANAAAGASEPPPAPTKPGRGASHAEWVAYAVANGLETDTAQSMTRGALATHFAGS